MRLGVRLGHWSTLDQTNIDSKEEFLMAQFQNFKDLDDFVENQIIPACTQFESQINELETKIKNCVTIQDTGNYVQQYDFDQLKIEVENMKTKVDEMFGTLDGDDPLGTVALRNEVAEIKKALVSHGILTP